MILFQHTRAGGGTTPHHHLKNFDNAMDLRERKYSSVYYLSVGDFVL